MADDVSEMYMEEVTPANEIKGFTKSFQKKTKDKREEDPKVKELLSFKRDGNLFLGARVTEKAFKNGTVKKVFISSNCDDLTLGKVRHYAGIAKIDIVELELDNDELGQKLGKPFLVSMAYVGKK